MITEKDTVYSIWLTTENGAQNRFADVIRKLSQTYHSKLFDPHITLTGGITGSEAELITKTEKLSRQLTRMTVKPQEINYLNEFHRSLFILVMPDEALINANKLAKQLFGLPLNEEFTPHLSLFYGKLPVKEKEKIKGKLDSKLLDSFYVNRIVLFCTCNKTNKWYQVESFPLTTKD